MSDSVELGSRILNQIEFYFSDNNVVRDRFMRTKIEESENGWVPLALLASFKRISSMSTDLELIADAVSKTTSGLIELSEDRQNVRRVNALPDADSLKDSISAATVYAKGFSTEASLDEILEFAAASISDMTVAEGETRPTVAVVRMRRNPSTKQFKGSVYIEFTSPAAADHFLAKTHTFKDAELSTMTQAAHVAEKASERATKGSKQAAAAAAEAVVVQEDCIVRVTGLPESATRESLRELFEPHAPVAFVDYTRGGSEAHIRFSESGVAAKAVEALLATNPKIDDATPTLAVLVGEDNVNYWTVIHQRQRDKRHSGHGGFKRGRGGDGGRFAKKAKKATSEDGASDE
ncbi:hypothetical protein H696_02341 [Fonticula alba]|uniref:Uncharacterized protein n=1 Tax=Fonticula alba TaxID=691883 RepID=A0A058ZBU1_FONAL|nr:hypothetical protein H696_02341 [Fonticula alba]KCV71393.1 hypothetical protein H696_02341 [Fonticula alba]|eukprot:XP_009494516.1 hypothetical protein H696_02341 [Fonticula alba]